MIDNDQVPLFPAIVLALVRGDAHEAVAVALDDVEPGLTGMAVQRLRLSRCELNHHLRQARRLIADGAIVEKLGAGPTRRGQDLLLVVRRVNAARAPLLRLQIDAPEAARVGIVARDAARDRRTWREAGERLVAGILEEA